MKIIWSEFASDNLKDIFLYHKKVAGLNVAHKLREKILNTTTQLITYPLSGQIEFLLVHLKEGHRYLVVGNYKIVYRVIG
jgi:plasmid stabilization system protein ParE